MTTVRLRKLPTGGTSRPSIAPGVSLQDFADQQGISGHDITVDGESIAKNRWSGFHLTGEERITATKSVKGA